MSWKRQGLLSYKVTPNEFAISLRPSRSRIIILIVFYYLLSALFMNLARHMISEPFMAIFLTILFSWPILEDLKEWIPSRVYRDGRVTKTFFTRQVEPNTKIFVYYKPSLKFTNIGLSYTNQNRKRINLKVKNGHSYSKDFEFVAKELATWMGVKYQQQGL